MKTEKVGRYEVVICRPEGAFDTVLPPQRG